MKRLQWTYEAEARRLGVELRVLNAPHPPTEVRVKVFRHHLYEYKKGLRDLVLHTTGGEHEPEIAEKLTRDGIGHIIHRLGSGNINVFFGDPACVEVLRELRVGNLSELGDEQDFMLGIMLGYNRRAQCERYLKRRRDRGQVDDLIG